MKRYRVYSLDVWGNEEDGFTVNDRCTVGSIEIGVDASDETILATLDNEGFIHASLCEVDDYSDGSCLDVVSKANGRPLLTLEEVES